MVGYPLLVCSVRAQCPAASQAGALRQTAASRGGRSTGDPARTNKKRQGNVFAAAAAPLGSTAAAPQGETQEEGTAAGMNGETAAAHVGVRCSL